MSEGEASESQDYWQRLKSEFSNKFGRYAEGSTAESLERYGGSIEPVDGRPDLLRQYGLGTSWRELYEKEIFTRDARHEHEYCKTVAGWAIVPAVLIAIYYTGNIPYAPPSESSLSQLLGTNLVERGLRIGFGLLVFSFARMAIAHHLPDDNHGDLFFTRTPRRRIHLKAVVASICFSALVFGVFHIP